MRSGVTHHQRTQCCQRYYSEVWKVGGGGWWWWCRRWRRIEGKKWGGIFSGDCTKLWQTQTEAHCTTPKQFVKKKEKKGISLGRKGNTVTVVRHNDPPKWHFAYDHLLRDICVTAIFFFFFSVNDSPRVVLMRASHLGCSFVYYRTVRGGRTGVWGKGISAYFIYFCYP